MRPSSMVEVCLCALLRSRERRSAPRALRAKVLGGAAFFRDKARRAAHAKLQDIDSG